MEIHLAVEGVEDAVIHAGARAGVALHQLFQREFQLL